MSKPSVLLIASQMPQQELGIIAQLLMSQGYKQQPASERPKNTASIAFETADKTVSDILGIRFRRLIVIVSAPCRCAQNIFATHSISLMLDVLKASKNPLSRNLDRLAIAENKSSVVLSEQRIFVSTK